MKEKYWGGLTNLMNGLSQIFTGGIVHCSGTLKVYLTTYGYEKTIDATICLGSVSQWAELCCENCICLVFFFLNEMQTKNSENSVNCWSWTGLCWLDSMCMQEPPHVVISQAIQASFKLASVYLSMTKIAIFASYLISITSSSDVLFYHVWTFVVFECALQSIY